MCACDEGYATANCSAACPGPADNRCLGHGACQDGRARDGSCLCAADWYAADCGVFCSPRVTCPFEGVHPAPHFQCNARTGACECQANASGHWAGPECNECRLGYWGLACAELCDCNGHGGCGRLDGVCECFQDEVRLCPRPRGGAPCAVPALCGPEAKFGPVSPRWPRGPKKVLSPSDMPLVSGRATESS